MRNMMLNIERNDEYWAAVGVLMSATVATFIFWTAPDRAWLHPELLSVGEQVSGSDEGFISTMRLLFGWQLFDQNTQRLRIISDIFELIDAFSRRYTAH